jgi:hypothetical protein
LHTPSLGCTQGPRKDCGDAGDVGSKLDHRRQGDFLCASLRCIAKITLRKKEGALQSWILSSSTNTALLSLAFGPQDGWTPLHWAVNNGHDKTVKMLVRAGANVTAKNKVRHHLFHSHYSN